MSSPLSKTHTPILHENWGFATQNGLPETKYRRLTARRRSLQIDLVARSGVSRQEGVGLFVANNLAFVRIPL